MLEELKAKAKVVGVKQTRRAVIEGNARVVYLACDADPHVIGPLQDACHAARITPVENFTMAQLGKACSVAVDTAACALLQ